MKPRVTWAPLLISSSNRLPPLQLKGRSRPVPVLSLEPAQD